MIQAVRNAMNLPDLRRKLLYTLLILSIYRLAAHVPVPGVDQEALKAFLGGTGGIESLLNMMNMLSGGAVARFSILATGVQSYITATLIFQLLGPIIPALERLQEELPDLDMALKFTDRRDAKLKNISLSEEEWKIVSYVKPSNSIRQISQANSMSDFQIRKIVYGMLQAGLVELVRPPEVAAPSGQRTTRGERAVRRPIRAPTVRRGIVNRLIERIKRL